MTEGRPGATAVRSTWAELPASVRSAVEERLGGHVVRAISQNGGFTHGVAARICLEDGGRAFVKAVSIHHEIAAQYRTEARIAAALPLHVPASRLRFCLEESDWIVMAFDDIDGRHPDLNDAVDLTAVLDAIESMTDLLTPNPVPDAPPITDPLGPLFHGWRRAAQTQRSGLDVWSERNLDRLAELESRWVDGAVGETLLHADLRADNLLITSTDAVIAVDWAWSCVGAAWVELVYLMPAIAAAGHDPEEVVRRHSTTRNADPGALDAFVCALAGHFTECASEPAPAWSPNLRTHEDRAARICRDWLARRTGWS